MKTFSPRMHTDKHGWAKTWSFVIRHSLFAIICVHLCSSVVSHAAFQHYKSVIITNAGNLTNGINVANSATVFQLTNRSDFQRTNLVGHYTLAPLVNIQVGYGSATNEVLFIGGTNLVVDLSVFGNWGYVSNYTSTVYSATSLIVPFPTAWSNGLREWMMTHHATNLDYATLPLNPSNVFASKLISAGNIPQNATNKSIFGGTNAPSWLAATAGSISGCLAMDPFGHAVRSIRAPCLHTWP